MKLVVTGGGTGGHVYPALAVLQTLIANSRWATTLDDVTWVGSADSVEERILQQEGVRFRAVSTGAIRGKNPVALVRNTIRMGVGYRQAREMLRALQPDVILATGGYVSVPVVLAGRSLGCPVMVYLPDMEPGLAVRFLSRFAQKVGVSFDLVGRYFPRDKVVVTGYPVRRALYETDKARAREALGLATDDSPVLLVLGGSRGAHSINEAVRGVLPHLLSLAQIVHISGFDDYESLDAGRNRLPEPARSRYHLSAYLYGQMTDALVAADLAVARAGAATLGEFPAVGLPAVLVPYPYAGQHQEANASYMAERGAAVIVPDGELGIRLFPLVQDLFTNHERLQRMSKAARGLAVPEAAERIADVLLSLAQERSRSS
ncbi:MAG: undecaprenyldiphospho-muramoylpentapeptide beta-N-acetylglucosaminyltransferase [Chloroflexi bacterium]|jgi:UDP-N-acetylglucosamine--N-acetylmuramyl-(pentapeptide) pyrophosphoryl-undecaprenol N-acetylglucosamine transferase|nr:undecaprenyldiphospho-muramoylpentapeptide beta-N-acetylglucosaminyltransferase [Chloroflexota bacterium]